MNWMLRRTLAPTLCALALTLTACGSDDEDEATTSEQDDEDAAADDDAVGEEQDDGANQGEESDPNPDAEDSDEEDSDGDAEGDDADGEDDAETPEPAAPGTIPEVAAAVGDFETLLAAAEAAGLVDALSGDGPLTVFAPTDAAFAALPEGTLDALLEDPEELAAVLSYHVVAADVRSDDLEDGDEFDSLLGPWLQVNVDSDGVTIGDAEVILTDVEASNGVIHVIDAVLLPPSSIGQLALGEPQLSTLAAALEAADLVDTLDGPGPFTVFAPTNEAFAALPEGALDALLADPDALADVLTYHVSSGRERAAGVAAAESIEMLNGDRAPIDAGPDGVRIGGANVIATDIAARNGVVHLIDAVLLPPEVTVDAGAEDTDAGAAAGDSEPAGNIIEVADSAGSFETLLAALAAADLVDTLAGPGPFTVFAPTDAAFDALPEGALSALLDDPEALAEVLTHHVIAGAVPASAVADGLRADTLLGPWLEFSVQDGAVSIGEANVISADVLATNGVIHVIDRVLLPPPSIASLAAANPDLSTLVTALEAAELVDTLDGPGPFTVFAPTNAAFDALPDGALDALLADSEALTDVLLYHVLDSRQVAADVLAASELTMLSGELALVEQDESGVRIAGAPIVLTDIVAKNGVVHVLDLVMLPPAD